MPFAKAKKRGSGVVKAILIIVLLGIIGITGWYVYRAEQNTARLDKNTDTPAVFKRHYSTDTVGKNAKSQTVITTTAVCPAFIAAGVIPADWKTYSRSRYEYRISYPGTWAEVKNGGSVNGLTILDGLLFTPPGNQGPLYDMYVYQESLSGAVAAWENSVSDGSYNNTGQPTVTKEAVLSVTNCMYQGYPAAEIVTKQNVGAIGVNYDIEFDVSAHGYLYDFSTGFNWTNQTLSNSSNPNVGDVLSVVESLHIY